MPRQTNSRNRGLKGKELDRYKYNWLLKQGFTSSQAAEYRRAGWKKIDNALELKKQGLQLAEKEYYKRKTEKKQAPAKKKKERAKEKLKTIYPKENYPDPPPGYHYAYYKKTGKYILRKNPTREKKPKLELTHLIFIKDQTDDVDASDFVYMMNDHRRKNNEELKDLIREWLHKEPQKGAIGRVRSYLASSSSEEDSYLNYNSGWALLLAERPSYHDLLAALATIAQGVYENWRKQDYAQEILYQTEEYSKRIYNKLVADDLI
jgi:hypothetical protein